MIVTRFPPSPTGFLHIGGLRTALYAYCFAKRHKGKIILRIEDTDQKRYVKSAEENLIKVLAWSGISFDEGPHLGGDHGPYRQSERTALYQKYAKDLLDIGKAYPCFCSEEHLERLRQKQEASKLPTRYDGKCRSLTSEEIKKQIEQKIPSVIRLKVPVGEYIVFDDMVRGKLKFGSDTLDDQILLKSDGFPTYHLANVVDDHLMEVTHVIRGEEWLSSTPKHVLLYQSFDWKLPQFAHLPLILNADRSKLSKRQGDVAVEDYIAKGYQKEELINFVSFLGWNPGGTREIYDLNELIEVFDLNKVQKGGAIFNLGKLKWFRGIWNQVRLVSEAQKKNIAGKIQKTKQGGYKIEITDDHDRYRFAEELKKLVLPFIPDEVARSAVSSGVASEGGRGANDAAGRNPWKRISSGGERFPIERDEKNELFLLRALYTVRDKLMQEPEKTQEFIACYFSPPPLSKELIQNEKMEVDESIAKKALLLTQESFSMIADWNELNLKKAIKAIQEQESLKTGQLLWPLRAVLTHVQFSPGAFESAWVLGKELTLSRIHEALQKFP